MYQIKFKYSLIKDIETVIGIFREREWLRQYKIIIFKPSLSRFFKILFCRPKITFESDIPVTCYWVSSGSWGAYEHPDKIIIMPFDLPDHTNLHEIIEHEIAHLKHPEAEDMTTHEEKEKYVESKVTRNS